MKNSAKITGRPAYWSSATRYLSLRDPIISKLITKHKSNSYLTSINPIFKTFCKIIIGQQISIEVANSIEKKIVEKIGNLSSKKFLNTDDQLLRKCGLSFRKIQYIKGIAREIISNPSYFTKINKMDDYEAVKHLTLLYGIGQWSAEMFLIFHFNRKNILPLGDIGLINSFCRNYNIERNSFIEKVANYKKLWSPYCTVATWYLWRDIDEDVVQY